MLSPCFLLSLTSLHTRTRTLPLLYSGTPVSRPCSGATVRPGHGAAAGVVMFPCSFLMSPSPVICAVPLPTHSPSPHLPPPYVHVSKTVCIGTDGCSPPFPAADPPTFDSCTAALLLPCITLQLQYVPSCTYVHAHMSYPPCIYVRTVHAPSSCLQPSPLRSPPSSPSPVSSSDRALCFGFSPVLDFGSGSGLSLVPVSFYSTYNLLAVRVCTTPITANHCTSTKCIKRLFSFLRLFSVSLCLFSFRFARLDVLAPLHAECRLRLLLAH